MWVGGGGGLSQGGAKTRYHVGLGIVGQWVIPAPNDALIMGKRKSEVYCTDLE